MKYVATASYPTCESARTAETSALILSGCLHSLCLAVYDEVKLARSLMTM